MEITFEIASHSLLYSLDRFWAWKENQFRLSGIIFIGSETDRTTLQVAPESNGQRHELAPESTDIADAKGAFLKKKDATAAQMTIDLDATKDGLSS